MALLCILIVTLALFALIGHGTVPAEERRPLKAWTLNDLARYVWLGLVTCAVDTPLDRTMEEMFRSYR